MAIKRKTYHFRHDDIIEVEEFHDGRYGNPGEKRKTREKPTKEQMQRVNRYNKTKRCRHRLLQYFTAGDTFATWTYEVKNRPPDMKGALKDFRDAMKVVRKEYKKRGEKLYWIRNIEQGTKGAWHIHLVINEIGDTSAILKKAWKKGGTYSEEIRLSEKLYDEDFSRLAAYMTKDEHTVEKKANGEDAKPRIREASYSISRNMPLPEPKKDKLVRWKREVKPKKGYYIAKIFEGINPVTGYMYRRYTQIRLRRRI